MWQRISAVLLVPLSLWFVYTILNHIGNTQQVAAAWIADPKVAVALGVYLVIMFFHSQLGLQVVVEDYVSSEKKCNAIIMLMKVVNLLAGLLAIWAVLRIAIF